MDWIVLTKRDYGVAQPVLCIKLATPRVGMSGPGVKDFHFRSHTKRVSQEGRGIIHPGKGTDWLGALPRGTIGNKFVAHQSSVARLS